MSEALGCTCVSADTFQNIETMFSSVQALLWFLALCAVFLYAPDRCNVVAFAFCMALLLVKMLQLWCAFAFSRKLQHVRWVLAICSARQCWARICLAQSRARVARHLEYHRLILICNSSCILQLLYTPLSATSFENYNVHVQWFRNPSKPSTNCNLKQYLTMRLQVLPRLLRRRQFFVSRWKGLR